MPVRSSRGGGPPGHLGRYLNLLNPGVFAVLHFGMEDFDQVKRESNCYGVGFWSGHFSEVLDEKGPGVLLHLLEGR